MESILKSIQNKIVLNDEKDERIAQFIIEDEIKKNMEILKKSFPENTLHHFAVKANPLDYVVKLFRDNGFGIECASLEEVQNAIFNEVPLDKIVYDSPCKTEKEIEFCLKRGIYLNVDNIFELRRIKKLRENIESKSKVGLRINPQIKAGTILETSTATATAKFGFPINEKGVREQVLEEIKDCDWVVGIHCHVGSGGMSFKLLVEGVKCITDLAVYINEQKKKRQIQFLDIGGGFPIEYDLNKIQNSLTFNDYWNEIIKEVPRIKEFQLITEYGRGIIGSAGYIASRIEYVKESGGRQIAIIHAGADILVWTAYSNEKMMKLYPIIYDKEGKKVISSNESDKMSNKRLDIVGPLCFSGDNVCVNLDYISELKSEDIVILPITGAYTYAVWSKFNSRSVPPIYLISNGDVKLIKERESIQDNLLFWKSK